MDNEPQPDAVLLIDPACGGQAHISADDYIEDAPEFVAEVAASSVSIDLHTKFRSTSAVACANTWCGVCWNRQSTGSSSAPGTTNGWCQMRKECSAVKSSPVCGSIPQRYSGVT